MTHRSPYPRAGWPRTAYLVGMTLATAAVCGVAIVAALMIGVALLLGFLLVWGP